MEINSLLDTIQASIYKVYYDLQTRENNVTAERVKNIFLGIEVKHQTVLELFRRHNEDVEKLVGITLYFLFLFRIEIQEIVFAKTRKVERRGKKFPN